MISIIVIDKKGNRLTFCPEGFDLYLANKWHSSDFGKSHKYLKKSKDSKTIFFHRELTKAGDGLQVDHINGNGLDNRLTNLRVVVPSENYKNRRNNGIGRSKYLGVYPYPRTHSSFGKYRASIRCNGKAIYLGTFISEIEAAKARDTAAKKFFSCCTLNFN